MGENRSHSMDVKPIPGGVYTDNHMRANQVVHPTMHMPGQIEDVQGESNLQSVPNYGQQLHGQIDVQCGNNSGADLQAAQQHYAAEQDHRIHHDNGGERMEEDQDGAGDSEGMEGNLPTDTGNFAVMAAPSIGNQLTLSFQGEVYVFDSVSPEKVQAVLLLLGGRELTPGVASTPSSHQNNRRSNFPQRVASLMRFREKRKERNFEKKIRYTVRKEVALRMQRNKGQFTSSKSRPEALGDSSWDSTQHWGVDDRPQAASACHHCGTNAKSTPMMRRGPDGPRTLCNACGLMWANKGTLKDLSKTPSVSKHVSLSEPNVGNDQNEMDGEQPLVVTANGHDIS